MRGYEEIELFSLVCCASENFTQSVIARDGFASWYPPVYLATGLASALVSLVIIVAHYVVRHQRRQKSQRSAATHTLDDPASATVSDSSNQIVSVLSNDSIDSLSDSRHLLPVGVIRILQNSQQGQDVIRRCAETQTLLFFQLVCDLLGCLFSVVRSMLWLLRTTNVGFDTSNPVAHILCSSSTVLSTTFYSCSLFWMIAYSYDVKRCWNNKSSLPKIYHSICWSLAILIGSLSELSIYLPEFNDCPTMTSLNIMIYKIVQLAAIAVALPVATVMFCQTQKASSVVQASEPGKKEGMASRRLLLRQFSLTILFLWVCWLPAFALMVLIVCAYYVPVMQQVHQYIFILLSIVGFVQSVHPVFTALIYTGIVLEKPHLPNFNLRRNTVADCTQYGNDANAAAM